jgi:AraC family transcriptional activator of pobA
MNPATKPAAIQVDRLTHHTAPGFFMERMVEQTFDATHDWPHRHDFQEILWVQAGMGRHSVDGVIATLTPRTLAVIVKGQVHNFLEAQTLTAYLFRFTDDFLFDPDHAQAERDLILRPVRGQHSLHVPGAEAGEFDALCTLLAEENLQAGAFGRYAVLRHLLHALLIKIERLNRLAAADGEVEHTPGYTLYHAFVTLLEQHYTAHHDVQFYAAALGVTPARLLRLLQEVTGRPAKRLILERLLLEAQRLLQFTPLTIKEIAHTLGFADQFHFSKVFKRETGLTPQTYRSRRKST